MNTNSTKRGVGYIKSFPVKGVIYNSLRYKDFPKVSLPHGPKLSREVQAAAKIALEAYQAQEQAAPAEVKKKKGTTLSDALSRYLETPAFRAMKASTQEKRRYILTALCKVGIPGGPKRGELVLSEVTRDNIKSWLAAREETPSAARNLLVALQHFFGERVGSGLLPEQRSPVLGVRLERRVAKRISKGHYETWTQAHVDAFRKHWGPETMERLAFEIMLATGMSAADVIRFSRSWVGQDGIIRYQRMKTETKAIPFFVKAIRAAIEACPLATPEDKPFEPILRDTLGRIWYKPGATPTTSLKDPNWRNQDFSQWFTKACRAAGLPAGISAHGVRKRAACNYCLLKWSNKKLMGWFGWSDPKEVALYTLEAEQELLILEEGELDAAD